MNVIVLHATRRAQVATIAALLHAFIDTHSHPPVRRKMLQDSLALLEAVKDEEAAELVEFVRAMDDALDDMAS